jgi:hypothetical protein
MNNEAVPTEEVKRVSLSETIVNNILSYLGSRPFTEVNTLIAGIQSDATYVRIVEEKGEESKK